MNICVASASADIIYNVNLAFPEDPGTSNGDVNLIGTVTVTGPNPSITSAAGIKDFNLTWSNPGGVLQNVTLSKTGVNVGDLFIDGLASIEATSSALIFHVPTAVPPPLAGVNRNSIIFRDTAPPGGANISVTFIHDSSAFAGNPINSQLSSNYSPGSGGAFGVLPFANDLQFGTAAAVPEPSSFVLLGIGALGALRYRKRKKEHTA